MYVYEAKFMEPADGDYREITRVFNDSDVLLDCVVESQADVWAYFVRKSLAFAAENDVEFVGLEQLAC